MWQEDATSTGGGDCTLTGREGPGSAPLVVHLRIIAPHEGACQALELLEASTSVSSVVLLEGAARKPDGNVILADVAREDGSVLIDDLRELDIPRTGSITIDHVDTLLSDAAEAAEEHAPGLPRTPWCGRTSRRGARGSPSSHSRSWRSCRWDAAGGDGRA